MASKTMSKKNEVEKKKSKHSKEANGDSKKHRDKGHDLVVIKKTKATISKKSKPVQEEPHTEGVKKPHHYHPGTVAMRKSKQIQKSADSVIPQRPLSQLIRLVASDILSDSAAPTNDIALHFEGNGLEFLRDVVENRMVKTFKLAKRLSIYKGRRTLDDKDIRLSLDIEKEYKPTQ